MNYKILFSKSLIHSMINVLIFINYLILISAKLDKIIRLGDENFRFIHFSSNINGDMVVDTSSYPQVETTYKERRFFGLKKNGRFYFKDENNKETPFKSIYVDKLKTYGESCFIQLSNNNEIKEYLFSFAINSLNAELYDFETNTASTLAINIFIGRNAISERSALFKSSLSGNTYYNIIGFIGGATDYNSFYLFKTYFESSNIITEFSKKTQIKTAKTTNKYIVSCFETSQNRIICLYQTTGIEIFIYDQNSGDQITNNYLYTNQIDSDIEIFFKGIHLKNEIGFFIYYKLINDKAPKILFKQYNSNIKKMEDYTSFGEISLSKYELNPGTSLNDVIKLNENKICIASVSPNKEILYIIILSLFENYTKMMINYYIINIFTSNNHKIYKELRVFLYNEYISFGFSHCSQSNCEKDTDIHYSSLIIFNYPNTTDINIDLIQHLSETNNDIDNFNFNLGNNVIIENNIFGYQMSFIKIIEISGNLNLFYKKNNTIILKNYLLTKNDDIKISFSRENYEPMNCTVEYAALVKTPNFLSYIGNANYTQYINMDSSEESYYTGNEYLGKSLYYNIMIKKELMSSGCAVENCNFCYTISPSICVVCNKGYTFDNILNKCFLKPEDIITTIPQTTILFQKQTTIITKTTIPNIKTSIITTVFKEIKIITTIPNELKILTTIPNKLTIKTTIHKEINIVTTIPKQIKVITTIPKEIKTTIPKEIKIKTTIPKEIKLITTIPNELKILTTIPNKLTIKTTIHKEINILTTISKQINVITTIPKEIKIKTTIPKEIKIKTTILKSTIPKEIKTITTTPIEIKIKTTIFKSIITNEIKTITTIPKGINILTTFLKSTIPNKIKPINTIPKIIKIETTISKEIKIITSLITTIIKSIKGISTLISSTKNKISIINKSSEIKAIPKSVITSTPEKKCSNNDILENKCFEKITNEQIKEVYSQIKKDIINREFNKNNNTNKIIQTENVIFQISTIKDQENNDKLNISSIDLSDCEQIIKKKFKIPNEDELIIFKTDICKEDSSAIFVQYEIYNPYTLECIPLDICDDTTININVPVSLNENTELLYSSLSNSGYNMFDLNDSFYTDVCTTYTTENGTDITLLDRKNLIYDNNKNVYLCQNGCQFVSYNGTTKRSKCNCNVQKTLTITNIKDLKFDREEFVNDFLLKSIKNSNFKVMKCYKLIFSLEGQLNNIGSYILASFIFILIILMICYFIKGNKKMKEFVQLVIRQKFINKINTLETNLTKREIIKKNKKNKINNKNKGKKNNKSKSKEKNLFKKTKNKVKPNSEEKTKSKNTSKNKDKSENKKKNDIKNRKDKKGKNFPPKKKIEKNNSDKKNSKLDSLSLEVSKDRLLSQFLNRKKNKKNILKTKNIDVKFINNKNKKNNNKKTVNIINYVNKIKVYNNYENNNINTFNNDISNKNKIKTLNDEEMNSLDYNQALILDKRTYFQYYFSLLKKKHLILFTFYPNNDYNLIFIKISLFLISFSLYFTINAFFFTDETMHKITEDNGAFNIIFQIPQILYSTLITAVINMILKKLSLSELQILSIKQEPNFEKAQIKSKKILFCLKIKFVIFFILSFLLITIFWYFIAGFCAVYKNTQIILIENTLLSFGISMIYPFGLNLLPGCFRIPALRAPKKDKKCLYKFSTLVSLI